MSKKFAYLKQEWTSKSIAIQIKEAELKSKRSMILALNYIGQEFIKNARDGGSYHDKTGNLRSSIGYAVFNNGKMIKGVFETANKDNNGEGVNTAKKTAQTNASKTGLCLIVVAGMDYAAAVESKGYDVLTIYAPSKTQVTNDLKRLLKYV